MRFLRFVPTPFLDFRRSPRHKCSVFSLEVLGFLGERQFTSASVAKLTARNIPSSENPPSWLYQRRSSARRDNSEYSGTRNIVKNRTGAGVSQWPMRPVPGKSFHSPTRVLPGGFIWRDGRMLNTDQCEVTLPGLQFKHADSSAFFSEVEYNVGVQPERVQTLVRSPGANPK
jgi:hypothetical protein